MALIAKSPHYAGLARDEIPPLENGDHLTREEFERRWELHPEIKKAELINGVAFIETTVTRRHGKPHLRIATWTGTYESMASDCEALGDSTVRLEGNDLQPDVLLRRPEGGSSTVSADDCVHGPPELAIEIAASSASRDLHAKREAYRRAGVQEYVVWQVYEKRIDWWELRDGEYVPLEADERGTVSSRVFPGLRLDVPAMLEGNMTAVLAALAATPQA